MTDPQVPEYPVRGVIPWDEKLKEYIDYGDTLGGEGPPGPPGPPGVPGGDTVQSMWEWEINPVSPPMPPGEIGVVDPPPRGARELITSCHDINNVEYTRAVQELQTGDRIYLQVVGDPNSWHMYELTGPPIDLGSNTYAIPVVTYSGSPPSTAPTAPIEVLTAFQYKPRPGPPGPEGPPGPPGSGEGGIVSFIHDQLAPSADWVVIHNLGMYPSVTVVDTGGTVITPDVHYDSLDQITIEFGSATSGKAYLS